MQRLPHGGHTGTTVVRLKFTIHFSAIPVPEVKRAETIARHEHLAICTEPNLTCISRIIVSLKDFLFNAFHLVVCGIDDDLVVHGLTREIRLRRVNRYRWNSMLTFKERYTP